jgi:hypothetical protein
MSLWADLVDAAVLGTARAAVPPPTPALADVAASNAESGNAEPGNAESGNAEPGDRLLRLAAVASRARRAGYVPAGTDRPPPDPAPPDERPPVSTAARQRLDDLLADGRVELLAEWLTLLARTGRRPPEAHLPALLTSATEHQQVRDALRPNLGPLAAWLAAANPAWDWATTATTATTAIPSDESTLDLTTWTTASHRTRRDMLDRLRRTDAASGRELVASTWTGDTPRDRTAFIAGLAVGLSDDDEALLDRALADRRGEVRQAAAGLLARLPDSAFSRRAASRAVAAVKVTAQNSAAGPQMLITPPPKATDDMIADGLDGAPPKGTGLASWLLRQVVAAAPAAWWTEHTKMSLEDLLTAGATTKWSAALAGGWIEAAIRDAHVPWLTALLGRFGQADYATALPEALLEALPAAERDTWLAAHPDSSLFGAVELVPWPWSATLSAAARDRIAAIARSDPSRPARRDNPWPNTPQQARRLLRLAAARLDPPAMPDLPAPEIHPLLAAGWAEMMNTLSVRAAMRRELAEEPPP